MLDFSAVDNKTQTVDEPDLKNTSESHAGEVNAVGRFVPGLKHDADHLAQIAEVARQARTARAGQPTAAGLS